MKFRITTNIGAFNPIIHLPMGIDYGHCDANQNFELTISEMMTVQVMKDVHLFGKRQHKLKRKEAHTRVSKNHKHL